MASVVRNIVGWVLALTVAWGAVFVEWEQWHAGRTASGIKHWRGWRDAERWGARVLRKLAATLDRDARRRAAKARQRKQGPKVVRKKATKAKKSANKPVERRSRLGRRKLSKSEIARIKKRRAKRDAEDDKTLGRTFKEIGKALDR